MADKRIVDLPALQKVTDDTLIPVYQPGAANPAQRMSGKQFKEFGEGSVSQYAESAANSASSAQSAYEGVKAALDSLPEGDTLIINDLTTGGTKAALSAEMGKFLGQMANRPTGSYTGNGDATARTIELGGLTSYAVLIRNGTNGRSAIVMYAGAIVVRSDGTLAGHSYKTAQFVNNKLTIATTDTDFNASGVTYQYQVL